MSAVQVLTVGVTFVVLYRYILDALGEAAFGVWSVVLATTSASHVANLGIAAGAVKFVAQYQARDERDYTGAIIQTAILSVAGAVGVIALILYPVLGRLLQLVIEPDDYLPDARLILPYALASFWIISISAVVQSSIDGLHRVYLRNLLVIFASMAYLGLTLFLVPRFGLEGLALAQFLQAALMLVMSWVVLLRLLPSLPPVPIVWRRQAFQEMLGYSVKFQAISIAQILYEPMAKAMLSKFGGVAAVASFEFAHRMAIQLRAIAATAHQAIVPAITHLHERSPKLLRGVYTRSFRLLLFLISASLPLLLSLIPEISWLWIGSFDTDFVLYSYMLLVGWFLNMLANPAYFANMGTGALKWNVYGQLIITSVFLLSGFLLGAYLGPDGIVVGYVSALLLGSLTIAVAYHRTHSILLRELLDSQTLRLILVGLFALALFHLAAPYVGAGQSPLLRMLMTVLAYTLLIAAPLLQHSMFREIQSWIRRAFVAT